MHIHTNIHTYIQADRPQHYTLLREFCRKVKKKKKEKKVVLRNESLRNVEIDRLQLVVLLVEVVIA